MGMGKNLSGLLALAFLASASAYAAEPPLVLEPASPWVADFQDESCAIRRTFAGEGQQVILELNNFGLADGFDVGIDGGALKADSGVLHARFEPDEGLGEHPEAVRFTLKGGGHGVLYGDQIFRRSDVDEGIKKTKSQGYTTPWSKELRAKRESEITGLFVADAFERDLSFHTGPLARPMDVMRQCIDDLLRSKGMDPVVLATLAHGPAPRQQQRWAEKTMADYPSALVTERKGGTVALRLLVDENGKVTDCVTQPRGEDPRLDKAACDSAFRYAQFDPAIDASGKPTKAFWSTRIVYSLN